MPRRDVPAPLARKTLALGAGVTLAALGLLEEAVGGSGRGLARAQPAPGASATGTAPAERRAASRAVEALAARVAELGGELGASVVALNSGQVLAAHRAHAPMNPASNAKLVTAAVALRRLGPEHRFVTGLFGEARGERVPELVLRGGGDPSLGAEHLLALARDLAGRGVRQVGAILVDQGYFDDNFVPPGFEQQPGEWASFRAPVAAASVAGNALVVTAHPSEEGKPARIQVEPPGFGRVRGEVRTTSAQKPAAFSLELEPPKGDPAGPITLSVGGRVPEGSQSVTLFRRVEDPRKMPGFVLKWALGAVGVEAGPVRLGGEGAKRALAVHRSPPLSEILLALGKESHNFTAEMVFKALAAEARGRPGTAEAAAELTLAELEAMGASDPGLAIKNGSGLFEGNRLTASALTRLLREAARDPRVAPEFLSHLAVGGVDGTLRGRLRPLAPRRSVRAKTGTLASVVALSGYVLGPPGEPGLAFSFLVSGVKGKTAKARAALDRAALELSASLWPSK